jgi:uncharacterized protein YycO
MKLLFATDNNIGSILTRWWLFSKYSHVAISKDGQVIEATFWHGVRQVPEEDFIKKYKEVLHCHVNNVDDEKAWKFASEQVGKPYDYTALFGLLFRKNWQEPDSYFCSELVACALIAGGIEVIRRESPRVTPQDLLNSFLVIPDV